MRPKTRFWKGCAFRRSTRVRFPSQHHENWVQNTPPPARVNAASTAPGARPSSPAVGAGTATSSGRAEQSSAPGRPGILEGRGGVDGAAGVDETGGVHGAKGKGGSAEALPVPLTTSPLPLPLPLQRPAGRPAGEATAGRGSRAARPERRPRRKRKPGRSSSHSPRSTPIRGCRDRATCCSNAAKASTSAGSSRRFPRLQRRPRAQATCSFVSNPPTILAQGAPAR